jgi:hypothetical protein
MAQYIKMAEITRTMKRDMVISVNDIHEMREVFADFYIESVAIKYSSARGVVLHQGQTP